VFSRVDSHKDNLAACLVAQTGRRLQWQRTSALYTTASGKYRSRRPGNVSRSPCWMTTPPGYLADSRLWRVNEL
jgi:hypothetical protein